MFASSTSLALFPFHERDYSRVLRCENQLKMRNVRIFNVAGFVSIS